MFLVSNPAFHASRATPSDNITKEDVISTPEKMTWQHWPLMSIWFWWQFVPMSHFKGQDQSEVENVPTHIVIDEEIEASYKNENLLYFEWSPPWDFKTATLDFLSAWSGQVRVDIQFISWNAFCYSQLRQTDWKQSSHSLSDIFFDILSDISSDSFLTYLLTFFLTYFLTYLLTFFLTYLLTFFLT